MTKRSRSVRPSSSRRRCTWPSISPSRSRTINHRLAGAMAASSRRKRAIWFPTTVISPCRRRPRIREPLLNLTELDSFRHVREQGRQRRSFPRHELPHRDRAGERSGRAEYVGSLLDLRQSEAHGSLSPRRNQPVEAKTHCRRVASQRHLDALAGKRLGIAVEEGLSGEGGLVARSSWVTAWVGAETLREFPAVRSAYVVTFRGHCLTPV